MGTTSVAWGTGAKTRSSHRWARIAAIVALAGTMGCGGGPEVRLVVRDYDTHEYIPGFQVTDAVTGDVLGETGVAFMTFALTQDPEDHIARVFLRSPEMDGAPTYTLDGPSFTFDRQVLETGTPTQVFYARKITAEDAMAVRSFIAVVSDPPGAYYTLGDWYVGRAGSPDEPDTFDLDAWDFFVPDSIYAFTFFAEGYDSLGMEIALSRGRNDAEGILEPETNTITRWTIESKPAGADITLDGEPTGEITPYTFIGLEPGLHTVRLIRKNYEPGESERTIGIGDRVANSITLSKIGSNIYTNRYKVRTIPYAQVFVDGGRKDWTAGSRGGVFEITLTEGKHKFRAVNTALKKDLTFQYDVERSDPPGKLLRLNLNTGKIGKAKTTWKKAYKIKVYRQYAEVYVDGDNINRNPKGKGFEMTLGQGEHRFHVLNEGSGIDRKLSYTVKRGDKTKTIILDPKKGEVRTEP